LSTASLRFISTTRGTSTGGGPLEKTRATAEELLDSFRRVFDENGDAVFQVRSREDLPGADGRIGLLLSMEGVEARGDDPSAVAPFWDAGVRMGGPSLDRSVLVPLLVMALAFSLLFVTLHLAAMRNEILRRRVRSLQIMQAAQASRSGPSRCGQGAVMRCPVAEMCHLVFPALSVFWMAVVCRHPLFCTCRDAARATQAAMPLCLGAGFTRGWPQPSGGRSAWVP